MIPLRRDAFVSVNTFKTQPESNDEIVALVSELAHVFFSKEAGYLASAVHASLDGERVVHYSQWETEQSYRNAVADACSNPGALKILRMLEHLCAADPRYYRVSEGVPHERATTIAMGTGTATSFNVFQLYDPAAQNELIETMRETNDILAKQNCGMLSSNVHVSLDGKAVANYVQWESADKLEAAMRLPSLRKLLRKHVELSDADVHLYEVMEVIPKAPQARVAS